MAEHNELGKKGEDIAAEYLQSKGFQILDRNWHNGHEEIDIVAKDGEMLVVVEVKTRFSDDYGDPDLAITKGKQNSIVRTADAYIISHNLDVDTRFDVISIILNGKERKIEHIEDAFYPTM